jgi:hypothetical protein
MPDDTSYPGQVKWEGGQIETNVEQLRRIAFRADFVSITVSAETLRAMFAERDALLEACRTLVSVEGLTAIYAAIEQATGGEK